MANDIITDDPDDMDVTNKHLRDEAVADPVEVVLMLQQESGNCQQEDKCLAAPVKQARIKERVLRRMLENSLEPMIPAKKPHLKIVKE